MGSYGISVHNPAQRREKLRITTAGRRLVAEVDDRPGSADGPFAGLDARTLFEGTRSARVALGDTEL